MPQPSDRMDFLYNDAGQSYYIDNGTVAVSGTPKPLTNTPDGWEGTEIRYRRNTDYFSIVRSFTTPLKFVREAAKIIRNRAWLHGFHDKIYLVINLLDKSFGGGWVYRFFYKGALDLTQIRDEKTGVSANIVEDGLSKILKANENTKYTIPLVGEGSGSVPVQLDGVLMDYKLNFSVVGGTKVLADRNTGGIPLVPLVLLSRDGQELGLAGSNQRGEFTLDPLGNYFLLGADDVTGVTISGGLTARGVSTVPAIPTSLSLRIRLIDSANGNQTGETVILSASAFTGGYNTYLFSHTLNITSGTLVQLVLYAVTNGASIGVDLLDSAVAVSYKYRIPASLCASLPPISVAQKLLNAMAGNSDYVVESPILSEWSNLVLTSGDGIRGTVADPINGIAAPAIITSFKEFFNAYNVRLNLCCKISGNTLVIDRKENAFINIPTLMFNNVRDLAKEIYNEYIFTRIKIGYPDVTIEDVNGKREFNVTQEYTTGLEVQENELTLLSNYFASMYEIEFTRMKTIGQTTTNNQNDNRIFFLHTNKARTIGKPYFNLLRKPYLSVSGLPNWQTAFNIELSPKRCLLAHGNFIRGCMFFQQSGIITFQNTQRNAELTTVDAVETISEKENVPVSQMAAPLFAPVQFTFESPIPKNIVQTLENEPSKTFIFVHGDFLISGFPLDVGLFPSTNAATETVLLAAPDLDVNALL